MKKRVFSALLAFCLAFSLIGTALAATAAETAEASASEPASETEAVDTETADTADAVEADEAEAAETAASGSLTSEGTDYSVTVDYGEDAGLPEGTALAVSEYETDSDTYQERYDQAAELASLTDGASDSFRLFDISLLSEGQEVEPAAAVNVAVTYQNVESFADAYDLQVFHFTEDGVERVEDADLAVDEDNGTLTVSFTAESFSDYGILLRGDSATVYPGNELDQSYYNRNAYVFWDTATFTTSSDGKISGGSANHNSSSRISSITLNGVGVTNGDSGSTRWSTSGVTQLGTYFPNATTPSRDSDGVQSGTLTIIPADGYYVTGVVIACASRTSSNNNNTVSGSSVYSCNTWSEGNAFTTSFSVGTSGTVTINLDSEDFSHQSSSGVYFILISVSPVPTPLYVEYNYGAIETILGNGFDASAFANANGWMTVSNSNVYAPTGSSVAGQAGVQTANTQFKYMYNSNSSETASSWLHYANTITETAKAEAAAAGYYFAGWYAEYYTSIDVSNATSGAYNNYNYNFDTSTYYGNATYSESDRVYLYTNVKLTAIWLPIELTITKTVEGLGDAFNNDVASYVLTVQKQGDDKWTDVTVTIDVTGNGSNSTTLKGTDYYSYAEDGQLTLKTTADSGAVVITPGTYQVVETDPDDSRTANSVTYYFNGEEYGDNAVITDGSITGGTTSYSLTVTNKYTDVKNSSLTISKYVSGPMGDTSADFTFTVTLTNNGTAYELGLTDDALAKLGLEKTESDGVYTFTLKHNDSITLTLPSGVQAEVTETAVSGYSVYTRTNYSGTDNGTFDPTAETEDSLLGYGLSEDRTVTVKMESTDQCIDFMNYRAAAVPTGIDSGSTAPYVVLTACAAFAGAALAGSAVAVRLRRRRQE